MTSKAENARLNILVLPGWYPSQANPTAGAFIREQARAAARYHDVTVLYATRVHDGPRGRWRVDSDRIEEGIRTVRLSWRELAIPRTALAFHLYVMAAAFRYIRHSRFSPDIIHGHVYFMAPAAVFLGWMFRRPVVITEHSSRFLFGESPKSVHLGVRNSFRRASMILPVSTYLQDAMESQGIVGRYRVIPNTYDPEVFFPPPDTPERKQDQDVPRLLTVGLLAEPKGLKVLLRASHEAVQDGARFHLDIVGDGPMRSECEKLRNELGLGRVVKFHGFKEKGEVARLMRRCSFYVQASLWETFGVTIVEAMASGKPIVATRIPTFEEKIGRNAGILVPPNDAPGLAKAIKKMLLNINSYDAHEISAYAFERFSYDAVGKALSAAYLDSHRRR